MNQRLDDTNIDLQPCEDWHCMCILGEPDRRSVSCHRCGLMVVYPTPFSFQPVCQDFEKQNVGDLQ